MKLLIIIPAFNEAQVIKATIESLKPILRKTKADVIVVDDGSEDSTADKALGSNTKVKVLTHVLNRGLGGAIGTGLAYAKKYNYDYAVTFDADGQHHPSDLEKILKPLIAGEADVVIGSRYLNAKKDMPFDRQIILNLSNIFTFMLFGLYTTDSLSGFRAFNKYAIDHIVIKTDRMEVSNEFFSEIRRLKLRLIEVPIQVIYTQYSRVKGQSNSNALNIIYKLLLRLFR